MWFSLCGWHPWYASPDPSLNYTGGASLGNSWRVDGDGRDWAALSNAVNTMVSRGCRTFVAGHRTFYFYFF